MPSTPAIKASNPAKSKTATKPPPKTSVQPAARVGTPAKRPATVAPTQPKAENWLNRTVQGYIGGAGEYAAGLVYGVGNGVNKVGEGVGASITNATRGWGQGVAAYGNDIKDAVGASGPRVATAANPLGIAGAGGTRGTLGSTSSTPAKKGTSSNPLGL